MKMKRLLQFIIGYCLLHSYRPLQFQRSKIFVQDKLKSMRVISTTQNEKNMNLFLNVGDFVRKIFPDETKITREDNKQNTVPPVIQVPEVKPRVVEPNNKNIEILLWTGITGAAFFILAVESSKYFFPLALVLGSYQVLRSAQPSPKSAISKSVKEEIALKTEAPVIVPVSNVNSEETISGNISAEKLQFSDSSTAVAAETPESSPLSLLLIQRLADLKEDLKGQLSLHEDMRVELSALKKVISTSTSDAI